MAISSGLYSVVETLLRSGADVSAADQVRAIVLVFISNSDLSVIIHRDPLKVQIYVPEDICNLLNKTKEV